MSVATLVDEQGRVFTAGVCEVCHVYGEVKFCDFCHAYICPSCTTNIPARVRAAILKRL